MTESPDRDQRLADALADYLDCEARGEAVDVDAFCRRHPDLEADLRQQLRTASQIDAHLDQPSGDEHAPERLSHHRILGEIGSGGMGRVFLAHDERLDRKVAIKTLAARYRDNEKVRTRFLQEARAMAQLNHANIARIYDLGGPDEPPHFVMEHVEGVPLTEAARPLPIDQKVELLRKVVLAADFLHRHQLIHRDIKPANILVGADLEPKLLDFGLALQVEEAERLTLFGEIVGTPGYFSPEQTRPGERLDARSDVFSLGTVFYELLTGVTPFRAGAFPEQIRSIRSEDPAPPRRLNPKVPVDLQNVCLKALEKDPNARYGSAWEMAADLERFLAEEPVLASPQAYSRIMSGRIAQHVGELDGWKREGILSDAEFDGLKKRYNQLVEPEDSWILEARRLSLPQVSLYLGGWILVVGAALIFLFEYARLAGTLAVAAVAAAAAPTAWLGIRFWRLGRFRIGVAYLLAFCLLLPVAMLVAMGEYGLFTALTKGKEELEFFAKFESFKRATNAQLWWALLLSLPAYCGLRKFTRSPVFSLVLAVMTALLCLVTLLRLGMLEWDPGKVYLRLIPVALLFFVVGFSVERLRHPDDSRYFYPIAVFFTWAGLSGLAATHEPYRQWLEKAAPWTHGQIEYLFIVNAAIYLALQAAGDRFGSSQMRAVAKTFRFVIPGHVLTSVLLLGLHATGRSETGFESRSFEVLLPALAAAFVFWSIPKQMKNYFGTGLLFLAIGIIRLEQNWLRDRAAWPVALLASGVVLMLCAANYAGVRMSIARLFRRR